jgi:asparagine synthase (glutamine-hydrolysing)
MCGILGYISTEGSQHKIDLEQWANTLFHRGPDEFGGFSDEGVGLGMRRLSIIDVANGHQPIFNEKRTVIAIFNGQIYNYEDLARELTVKGHVLNSESDGEVIVHLFEEYGEAFVNRLEGMFSIALYDTVAKKLYLFRDRIGKKPLVYFHDKNGNLFFASELKSLLKVFPKSKDDISPKSLGLFLELGYVPSPFTIFEQFRKLPPASFLTWEAGSVTLTRYWEPTIVRNKKSLAENKENLKFLLRQAVDKRLMSERPLGAFLSGGIDSSLVVAFMSELSQNPVKTFSVGFDHAKFDESSYALEVAQRYGTEHTQITLNDGEILEGFLESFEYYDEPFADSSSLATFLLSKKTAECVTVVLSGDGGDESFGGYERYVILKKYSRYLPFINLLKVAAKLKILPFFLLPS